MGTILDRGIDAQRADDIAATARAMGEAPVLREFIVSIKRGQEVRRTFPVMGVDSCTVITQHEELLQEGEKLDVVPRRRGFDEGDWVAADIARNVNKGPRLAQVNDAHAMDLQVQMQGYIGEVVR